MRAALLPLVLTAVLTAPAGAATVLVDGQVHVVRCPDACPRRGATMHEVRRHFGAPTRRFAAVGKPPITRWDYPAFSVYFEYNRVIHSVAHD